MTSLIAPVIKTIVVNSSPQVAFRVFTEEIGEWWPLETHTRANREVGERAIGLVVEPRPEGRVYEVLEDGRELDWGVVAVFEPGVLFSMHWRLGRPDEQGTLVSVHFEVAAPSGCRITLTHENWERMGEDGARMRDAYENGWVEVFERRFLDHLSRTHA